MKIQHLFAILFTTVLLSAANCALADEAHPGKEAHQGKKNWNKDHPRRHEVNARLNNQNKRINKEEREGKISQGQAASMHKEDHQIRQEERSMASQDGGHVTKQEQKSLNQQENGVNRQIGN